VTLIDTDILVDAGREVNAAVDILAKLQIDTKLSISVVTQMELLVGCRNKAEMNKLDRFLKRFQVIRVDERISAKAVEHLRDYRLSHGLLIADSFIAATAILHNLPFISKNQSDYRFITGLNLLPYP
jgi:predicted nucleic acid-binding protein